jgi:hypothetical protein
VRDLILSTKLVGLNGIYGLGTLGLSDITGIIGRENFRNASRF